MSARTWTHWGPPPVAAAARGVRSEVAGCADGEGFRGRFGENETWRRWSASLGREAGDRGWRAPESDVEAEAVEKGEGGLTAARPFKDSVEFGGIVNDDGVICHAHGLQVT